MIHFAIVEVETAIHLTIQGLYLKAKRVPAFAGMTPSSNVVR